MKGIHLKLRNGIIVCGAKAGAIFCTEDMRIFDCPACGVQIKLMLDSVDSKSFDLRATKFINWLYKQHPPKPKNVELVVIAKREILAKLQRIFGPKL